MDSNIPRAIRAADFATNAPGLTAPGRPFEAYAASMGNVVDCSGLAHQLRPHAECYPVWVCPDLTLYLEYWDHPPPPGTKASAGWDCSRQTVSEELLRVAEPKSRPDLVHCYALTADSLHGASSTGMTAAAVLALLAKFSKTAPLPPSVVAFVETCASRHCRAKLLLLASRHYVVSDDTSVLDSLLARPPIREARMQDEHALNGTFEVVESVAVEEERARNEFLAAQEAERLRRAKEEQAGGLLAHQASWGPPPSSPIRRQEAWDRDPECLCCGLLLDMTPSSTSSSSSSSSSSGNNDDGSGSALGVVCDTTNCGGTWCQACAEAGKGGCLLAGGVFYCGTCAVRPAVKAAALAASQAAAITSAAAAAAATSASSADGNAAKKRLVLNLGQLKKTGMVEEPSADVTSGGNGKRLKLTLPKPPGSEAGAPLSTTTATGSSRGGSLASKVLRAKTLLRFAVRGSRGEVESVRRDSWAAGYPLLEEYDYQRDSRNQAIMVRGSGEETRPYGLKPHVRVRDYQEKALFGMFGATKKARSGIIVLPCGAGKTLVGISAAVRVGRSTVVLCNNNAAVEQWHRSFLDFTDIPKSRLLMFHAKNKPEKLPDPCVLLTTYSILAERKPTQASASGQMGDQALATQAVLEQIRGTEASPREWALMVLDEVHMAPARCFRTVMDLCKAQCKLGLTATLVREDDKIEDLAYLIGPKLHEANWTDLANRGFLATVRCHEVWCPMSKGAMAELLRRAHVPMAWERGGQKLLSIMNPHKFRAAEYLLRKHEEAGDKVLLFSDNIYSLTTYCEALSIPNLRGLTNHQEREALLGCFRGDKVHVFARFVMLKRRERSLGKCNWEDVYGGVDLADSVNKKLFEDFNALTDEEQAKYQFYALGLSSVGDVAIDLPDANVLIQVSGHGGGRRQEAQRLGRILRPKSAAMQAGKTKRTAAIVPGNSSAAASAATAVGASSSSSSASHGSSSSSSDAGTSSLIEEVGSNCAHFYTLVSQDTHEVFTSAKRQEYLIDQGYTYKVLLASELLQGWTSPSLPANSPQEQALLQATVDAISAGKGGSDDSAAATASASPGGGPGGGPGKRGGRKKAGGSAQPSAKAVVASKYTQPGRYHLLQMKKKASNKRKASAAAASVVVVD